MKRQDKQGMESTWVDAFESAEMSPSAQLWDKVELGIAKNANNGYKKRILFFKLMAAASVLLAAVIGGVSIYTVNNPNKQSDQLVLNELAAPNKNQHAEIIDKKAPDQTHPIAKKDNDGQPKKETNTQDQTGMSKRPKEAEALIFDRAINDNEHKKLTLLSKEESNEKSNDSDDKTRVLNRDGSESISPDSIVGLKLNLAYDPASLPHNFLMVPRLEHVSNQKKSYDRNWIGVGLAMGQNSPSSSADNSQALASLEGQNGALQNQDLRLTEEQNSDVINVGVAIGKQISKRWILESGLSYFKRTTLSESNLAINGNGRAEAFNSGESLSQSDQLVLTNSYELKNTYNSISIPIQAGYLILDRQLDIILKGGFANDVLLWNRVEDTSGNLEDNVIKSGSDSQYSTYQLSGILSSEFSYLLGRKYSVSLMPQLRKPISSTVKSAESHENDAMIFTVGFRFKYLLK